MPAYARSFELEDEKNFGIGASVAGPGEAGTYTKEPGFLSYYEVRIVHITMLQLHLTVYKWIS